MNKRRILIADDEANMRWVLERALSKAGYEVETAEDYEWPGNVRELENVIERMVIISSGTVIGNDELPVFNTLKREEKGRTGAFELPPEGVSLEELEKSFLKQALEQTAGNQSQDI